MTSSRHYLGLAVIAGLGGMTGAIHRWRSEPSSKSSSYKAPLSFYLEEISEQAGVVNKHESAKFHRSLENIQPYLAAVGSAHAAVVDFDNDGWMDIYVTNGRIGSHNRLFRNNGNGTFSDVADKVGLGKVNQESGSLAALFMDYDNDGKKDLLLKTFTGTKVFHNEGHGAFRDVSKKMKIDHRGLAYALNAFDYDRDGFLDIIIANTYNEFDLQKAPTTTRIMPNGPVNADNGGPISIYRNVRGKNFSPAPNNLSIQSRGWVQAIGIYDFSGTGREDLYFASDYGPDQFFQNEGAGRFIDASALVHSKHSKSGMSAEIADIDNDGHPSIIVTNIHQPPYTVGENVLWKWTGKDNFVDQARSRGVSRSGWAWGAKFIDLDNNGLLDLAVSNGMISANPKKSYLYTLGVLYSGRGSFMEDAANWPALGDASLSGYQRDFLYYNTGTSFIDVSNETSFKDDRLDGRGIAVIDALNSGSLGFIVVNQGQPLRYYQTRQKNNNHWIGFSLEGTRSSRDAWGARVIVHLQDGKSLTRELHPANGFMSQSDPRLHIGLGPNPRIKKVEIRWPSGISQFLNSPAQDRYHRVREK